MEYHTYLQITQKCNQKCVFCNRPPEKIGKRDIELEEIKKKILSLKDKTDRLIFTGGEPTLRKELPELISLAKRVGIRIVELQTNGTKFQDRSYVKVLKDSGLDRVYIALHAHEESLSQKLRRARVIFSNIVTGIKNSINIGIPTSIIHVINSLNYMYLPEFVKFVKSNFPGIENVNLSIVVPEGWAWKNKWIIPRYNVIKPFLLKAMKFCKENKIKFDVSEVVPLCIVNGFEEYATSTKFIVQQLIIVDEYYSGKRLLEFKNLDKKHAIKAPQCEKCSLNKICAGFHPRYAKLFGFEDYTPSTKSANEIVKKIHKNISKSKLVMPWEKKDLPKMNMRGKILYLFLTGRCNQDCVFCISRGGEDFGELTTEQAKEKIKEFVERGGNSLQFTGGEPTIRDDLPEIIHFALKSGIKNITIITNAVRLADEVYLRKLINSVHNDTSVLWFSVSLHSHRKKISDMLTRAPGTFEKTIKGIKNILSAGFGVNIYHVITSKNCTQLEDFITFLSRNFPQIKSLTLSYVFPQGNALKNPWVYPRLSELKKHLSNAVKLLEKYGIDFRISVCGTLPLCCLPGYEEKIIDELKVSEKNIVGTVGLKKFNKFEMTDLEWERIFKIKGKQCEFCILEKLCRGLWKEYAELYGTNELNPIFLNEFKRRIVINNLSELNSIFDKLSKSRKVVLLAFDFDEDKLTKENGKIISRFLKKLDENAVNFAIVNPLPRCIFGQEFTQLKKKYNIPTSCETCLEFLIKNGDKLYFCKKLNCDKSVDVSILLKSNKKSLFKQNKSFFKKKVLEKCLNCIYLIRGLCGGVCKK